MNGIKIAAAVLIGFLSVHHLSAQEIDTSKIPDLSPYEGIWAGSNGTDSLVVVLKKKEVYFEPLSIFMDQLYGNHYYTENINDRMMNSNVIDTNKSLTIGGKSNHINGIEYLRFYYIDPITNVSGSVQMLFEHGSDSVVTWQLRNQQGVYIITEKQKAPPRNFSIPMDMILRKIE